MQTRTDSYGGAELEATETDGVWVVTIDGKEVRKNFPSAQLAMDYARRRVTLRNRRETRAETSRTEIPTWTGDEAREYFALKSRERHNRNRALLLERHGLDLGSFEAWENGDE